MVHSLELDSSCNVYESNLIALFIVFLKLEIKFATAYTGIARSYEHLLACVARSAVLLQPTKIPSTMTLFLKSEIYG